MRSWQDVRDTIGDAFTDSLKRIRYCFPTPDANRARWPTHGLWRQFEEIINEDLQQNCAGVLPNDVINANCVAKMRELDALLTGVLITRAAISDMSGDGFGEFMGQHVETLLRRVSEHPVSVEERIVKARGRYRLR